MSISSSKLAFDIIAGPGGAVDVLLVQTHANQTRVLIWYPTLHVLYENIKSCVDGLKMSTRGRSQHTLLVNTSMVAPTSCIRMCFCN